MRDKVAIKMANISTIPKEPAFLKLIVDLGDKDKDNKREDAIKEFGYTSREKYSDVTKLSTVNINLKWFLGLEVKSKKDIYSKETLAIMPKQVPLLLDTINKAIKLLEFDDLFIINDENPNNVKMDINSKYKGKSLNASFGFRGKEIITIIPCVVYNEEQDIPETEGVQIVLNGDHSVSFNMTMTELIYTKYILEKTDFIVMATHVLTTIGKPDKIAYVNMDAKKMYNTYEHSAEAPNTESMGANNSVAKLLNRGVPTVEDDLYNL